MFRLALFTLLASAALAVAADWPMFRGEKRDNVSPDKDLLKSWPKDGPKLLWKGTGVGDGFSSVSVVGDQVYTMGNKSRTAYIFALDRKSGKLLWEAKVGSDENNRHPGTRCTPTVNGDLVYGLGAGGDLVCVTAAGKEKWRKSYSDYGGASGGWKFAESPLVDGDVLVCTPGGSKATLLALNKTTGEEVWKAALKDQKAGYASVVISNAVGVKQYVTLTGAGTVGVDAKTGKQLWQYNEFAGNTANIPTPIVLDDQIFTAAGYGRGTALLTLTKDGDGVKMKESYLTKSLTNKHGGLVIVGDYVYGDAGDRGDFACAEWKTGKVKWKQTSPRGKEPGSASVTYADGHLYIRYANGRVVLVPATPDGYQEVSSFKIENSNTNGWAHPVVIDGCLYLREKDVVWCYDVKGK